MSIDVNRLAAALANVVADQLSNGGIAVAAAAAPAPAPARPAARCCEQYSAPVVETVRKSVKVDLPGFTNKSARVTLRRTASGCDEFVITANNQFRGPVTKVLRVDGAVVRSSVKAQLKLGVLKVEYHVYKSSTSYSVVSADRASKEIAITMKNA